MRRDEDEPEIASTGLLRRMEKVAGLWALTLGVMVLGHRGWGSALVLTGVAVASIVAFRSLEGVVRRLHADDTGLMGRGGSRCYLLRWFLFLAIVAASFFLGSRDVFALVLGLTVIPLALITEAAVQVLGLLLGRES